MRLGALWPALSKRRDLGIAHRHSKQWDAYQRAYSNAIAATGTPWAPWTIVPADSKTHRKLMIGTAVVETLKKLKLRYPPGSPELASLRIE